MAIHARASRDPRAGYGAPAAAFEPLLPPLLPLPPLDELVLLLDDVLLELLLLESLLPPLLPLSLLLELSDDFDSGFVDE